MGAFEEACLVVEEPRNPLGERAFWERSAPVIVDGKMVRGGFFPHQVAFWNLPNFIKILVGGYGSGKTNIGSKRIIALALQNAPCPVGIVSPSFRIARRTVVETISTMLAGKRTLYGRKFWWRYNRSLHEYRIRFRGREANIGIFSGDDPDSLRGPNLAAAYIDEPFLQEKEVFKQMIARVRHPEATTREIIMTGTPEQLNWGYDICMGDEKGQYDSGVVFASTRANLALDPGYVGRLSGAYTEKAAAAYIEGKFVNLSSGLVYYGFDPQLHVHELPIPEGAELGCGMDFNVNPMAFTVFWRAGSHVHFFKEFELPNADTEYACSVLREEFRRPDVKPQLEFIYPDASGSARKTSAPSGKSDFWYIRNAGFNVRANHENGPRKDRYNAVNGKFRPKLGAPTISIDPKCRRLIKYLANYTHENMNKQEEMSHLLDAFSYPISFLFPVDYETLSSQRLQGF